MVQYLASLLNSKVRKNNDTFQLYHYYWIIIFEFGCIANFFLNEFFHIFHIARRHDLGRNHNRPYDFVICLQNSSEYKKQKNSIIFVFLGSTNENYTDWSYLIKTSKYELISFPLKAVI